MGLAVPVAVIGITGLVCGTILAVAARFFHVEEDPRIAELLALLPGANCGGCGFPGCSEYVKEMLWHGAPINLCKAGGDETLQKLSLSLGVTAAKQERSVAIVLCQGDDTRAKRRALYNGIADCRSAELAGGDKACRYGCLGLGSCARVCPVGAIEISGERLAVVHPDLCIGCGKCVATCPRQLIKIIPESRTLHVLCRSKDRGPLVKKYCSVGCIACTICAKTVNNQGIKMEGALAVVDYAAPLDNREIITKCPQHTIVERSGKVHP